MTWRLTFGPWCCTIIVINGASISTPRIIDTPCGRDWLIRWEDSLGNIEMDVYRLRSLLWTFILVGEFLNGNDICTWLDSAH